MRARENRWSLIGQECECRSVDTVSEACGFGAILKNMSLVAFASGTVDLCPRDKECKVCSSFYDSRIDRLPKTRPAGSTIELMRRRKQWKVAPCTVVRAGLVILMQGVDECSLRIFMS